MSAPTAVATVMCDCNNFRYNRLWRFVDADIARQVAQIRPCGPHCCRIHILVVRTGYKLQEPAWMGVTDRNYVPRSMPIFEVQIFDDSVHRSLAEELDRCYPRPAH